MPYIIVPCEVISKRLDKISYETNKQKTTFFRIFKFNTVRLCAKFYWVIHGRYGTDANKVCLKYTVISYYV